MQLAVRAYTVTVVCSCVSDYNIVSPFSFRVGMQQQPGKARCGFPWPGINSCTNKELIPYKPPGHYTNVPRKRANKCVLTLIKATLLHPSCVTFIYLSINQFLVDYSVARDSSNITALLHSAGVMFICIRANL
jgi:hypothetical protein